jgi:UDP-N-acetylglucosamine kinase
MTEEEISLKASKEIRQKKSALISKYAGIQPYPADLKPASVFMAGSPGAGKTEFSTNLIHKLGSKTIRIDSDEIRKEISFYDGKNAWLFQNAVSIAVDEIFNSVLKNQQSFLLDGTMASLEIAMKNIGKVLAVRDSAEIYFIYQDPMVSWQFTKDRELIDGRNITKPIFISAYFASKENVTIIKNEFGTKIRLNLVIKDALGGIGKTELNIDKIDNHIRERYTENDLNQLLVQ